MEREEIKGAVGQCFVGPESGDERRECTENLVGAVAVEQMGERGGIACLTQGSDRFNEQNGL